MLRFRDDFNAQGAHRSEIVYSKCKVSAGRDTHTLRSTDVLIGVRRRTRITLRSRLHTSLVRNKHKQQAHDSPSYTYLQASGHTDRSQTVL